MGVDLNWRLSDDSRWKFWVMVIGVGFFSFAIPSSITFVVVNTQTQQPEEDEQSQHAATQAKKAKTKPELIKVKDIAQQTHR